MPTLEDSPQEVVSSLDNLGLGQISTQAKLEGEYLSSTLSMIDNESSILDNFNLTKSEPQKTLN